MVWLSRLLLPIKTSMLTCNVAAQSAWGKGAGKFAELVAEKSGGKINVKVYYSAQLMAGKQTSEFMIVRNEAADFALSSTINWSPQATELNLLPFLSLFQSARSL